MIINKKGNAVVFSVILTTIIGGLVGSIALYTYSIYFRIVDLQSQVYLSLEAESIKNKKFIDYLTDPINNANKNLGLEGNNNISINKFGRFKDEVEDNIIPGKVNPFFLTDLDLESQKSLNRIKSLGIFYKKPNESNTGFIRVNFVRYNKLYSSSFQGGTINLPLDSNCINPPESGTGYDCFFDIQDFSGNMKGNIFNYLLFFSSNKGISYQIKGYDINKNIVQLPARHLEQDIKLSNRGGKINRNITSKVDLYDRFNLNINMSLYNIQ